MIPVICGNRRDSIMLLRAACLILLLAGAGCRTAPPAGQAPAAGDLPPAPPLPRDGGDRYGIDSARSQLRILVYRGGPLAEFGHNHVISAGELNGVVFLTPALRNSGFEFNIPVRSLKVDPPSARSEEGGEFAKPLSEEAVRQTRDNMLSPAVLDPDSYPQIRIRSLSMKGPDWGPDVTIRITLHGVSRDMSIPVALRREEDRLVVTGAAVLHQSHFGMTPFSVMGGGLQVQDRLRIRFRIVATREE